MSVSFMPVRADLEDLHDLQLQGLKWTVSHAYNNSPFYRDRLDKAGTTPAAIRSLDDLRRLPFTSAEDLQGGYPFPLRSVLSKRSSAFTRPRAPPASEKS